MAALPTVTLTGLLYEEDHVTLYNGVIEFVLPVMLKHGDGTAINPGALSPYQVVNGIVNIELLYVDAPGWGPVGWAWEVRIPQGSITKRYTLAPSVNDPDTVNLGDLLSPFVPSAGSDFAPATHTHPDLSRVLADGEVSLLRDQPTTSLALADRIGVLTHFTAQVTETIQKYNTTIASGDQSSGSTHAWVAIYKYDGVNYTPDVVSVDDPTRWASPGSYDTQLFDAAHPGVGGFEGWHKVSGQRYATFKLWRGASTPPKLAGRTIWPVEAYLEPRINGILPAQDFPPTVPFPAGFVQPDTRLLQAHFKR